MIDYNYALEQSKDASGLEDDDQWDLIKPTLSFAIWKACKAFDWQFLPFPGGLLDQPEWLMHDVATLNWLNRMCRRDMGIEE